MSIVTVNANKSSALSLEEMLTDKHNVTFFESMDELRQEEYEDDRTYGVNLTRYDLLSAFKVKNIWRDLPISNADLLIIWDGDGLYDWSYVSDEHGYNLLMYNQHTADCILSQLRNKTPNTETAK